MPRRTWLAGMVLGCIVLPLGASPGPCALASEPGLENRRIRLDFDGQHGRLIALRDVARSIAYLDPGRPQPLWSLDLAGGGTLTADQARSCSWARPQGEPARLQITWSDFDLPEAPALKVHVEVSLDGDQATTRWGIRLENPGELVLRAVHFPRIGGLAPQPGETLAVPVWMGEQTRQARRLLNPDGGQGGRREWEYPGRLSMQLLTWHRASGQGLFLATNDPALLRKQFAVVGDGQGGLALEVVHLPTSDRANPDQYQIPYNVLLGAHEGGWYGAAQEYRTWAREQSWVKESRLKRGVTPDWLRQTGLWVWNRDRSEEVLTPALLLQDHAGLPVSVFWHWWHGCAYDAGFPEYLPPREGTDAFKTALAAAQDQGIKTLVYMNQRLWGMTTESWTDQNAARYAVKRPDGTIAPEVYNRFMKTPCASMCMGTAFWRDTYAGLAAEAVNALGVDGIYMDQACSSLACYDPGHGHPPGGGSYWMEGFRRLAADIRDRTAPSGPVTLAGEGCGEAWLPHLDAMLSLQVSMERYAAPGQWEPIPLFQAVYHDCVLLYGNYSSLTRPPYDSLWPEQFAPEEPLALLDRKFAHQFRLEQARAFVWGQQPTLANFTPRLLEDRKTEIDFLLHLARLRQQLQPFLQEGTMLRPLELDVPEMTIPMSRLSIYAGQQESVQEFTRSVPRVLSSVWQAPDARVAVVLVNISDQPVTLTVSLSADRDPIAPSGTIRIQDENRLGPPTPYQDGAVRIEVTLPPASARVALCETQPS